MREKQMPVPNESATDRDGASIPEWTNFERRPLLKALGFGTALSLGSGVATANTEDNEDNDTAGGENGDDETDGDGDGTGPRPPHLDSYYGFATPDAEQVPDYVGPDHEVELHTVLPADPENPDRPPIFHFEPAGLHVQSGDIVQFTLEEPDHTITAYHPALGFQRRVPEGAAPFSSPVLNVGGAWLYQFDIEGVYDMYCGPHHNLGMNMRMVVGDLTEEDIPDYVDTFEGSQDPPLFAPFSKQFLEHELNAPSDHNEDCEWTFLTSQEVLSAPSLDPVTIQEQGSVPFENVLGDLDRFPDELADHGEE